MTTDVTSQKRSGFFSLQNLKTKGLSLLIEHSPCCILSFVAGFVGISFLNHNPVIELGFALGGALLGEYIGHKIFHRHTHCHNNALRRYAIALAIGLVSWALHQVFIHHV